MNKTRRFKAKRRRRERVNYTPERIGLSYLPGYAMVMCRCGAFFSGSDAEVTRQLSEHGCGSAFAR